jgi:pimeloyl-ACP methyl ester carboxylesterase
MFSEGHVDVAGARIRHAHAGQGPTLVHLLGAGGLALTRAHDLLSHRFRVIALEVPDGPPRELAGTISRALEQLGVDAFDLMATGRAGPTAARLALAAPGRTRALVLEAPEPPDADLERQLPGLATPTLVLIGTADRAVAGEHGRVYKERLPSGHLVFVYDAAHAIGADRPEAFTEVVADFLERHEAFIISRTATIIHP